MNTPPSSVESDPQLKNAKAGLANIDTEIKRVMHEIDAWRRTNGHPSEFESVVMSIHAWTVHNHAVAMAERIACLGAPSDRRVLLMSGSSRILENILGPKKIEETKDAYDEAKINNLSDRDIRDAIEFDTELKDMFGLASMDDELRVPLHDALHVLHNYMEDGITNVAGPTVMALKALLKGHPRGFGRYYMGTDRWPRPSAEVQAEIDARMPDALWWLRQELEESMQQEAASTQSVIKTRTASGPEAAMPFPERLLQGGGLDESLFDDRGRRIDVDEGFFDRGRSTPGYLPIEADKDLRERIEADQTINHLNLETLDDLKLLLASDAEKDRVFCGSLDDTAKYILGLLLEVAIREIENDCATVVGVVNVLIGGALDIRVAERRNILERVTL